MSKVPSDQKSQYVDPCTTFTSDVIQGQSFVISITPVRKVVQVYSFVFLIQHGNLHLTPRAKVKSGKKCLFWEKTGNEIEVGQFWV